MAAPTRSSTPTPTTRTRRRRRDAVQRRLQVTARDHDGDDQEAPHPRQALVRAEADLADRVRLPDESTRHVPGRPPKRQATLLSLAAMRAWRLPRVTMLIQYLYRDEPAAQPLPERPRVRGRPLEALAAGIQAAVRADGATTGTRPSSGVRSAADGPGGRRTGWRCSTRTRGRRRADRLTNEDGVFIRTIRLKPGALLRIWSPRQRRFSLQLRIR